MISFLYSTLNGNHVAEAIFFFYMAVRVLDNKSYNFPLFVLLVLLLASTKAYSRDTNQYVFDKDATTVQFSASRLGIFELDSQFKKFDGSFSFCTGRLQQNAISIILYSSSIDADDEDTNEKLKSPDFFDATKFPEVTFVSTSIERTDDRNAKIYGDLTLLGITKSISLDANFINEPSEKRGINCAVGFIATGVISRSDFGMTHLIPLVGDEIKLRIEAKGI